MEPAISRFGSVPILQQFRNQFPELPSGILQELPAHPGDLVVLPTLASNHRGRDGQIPVRLQLVQDRYDISTGIGDEIILFTLDRSPDLIEAK